MNKDMMKKNVHAHVLLQPPACRLDANGFEVKITVSDDWWLIQSVEDDGVIIADPRTGHFRLLGYDHIQKFTSDGVKAGAKRGYLTLHVQIFVQGNDVRVVPNARPGESVPAKTPAVVEKTVEFQYPNITGLAAQLTGEGWDLGWVRSDQVESRIAVGGWQIVLEPDSYGGLSRFRTRDGLVLLKRRR